ncbi:MAG: hypothetical protein V1871_06885 [Planctomycetota bacterium]
MKKIFLLACLFLLTGCGKQLNPVEYVENNFGFHIPSDVRIIRIDDTHDGFHGDGTFYLEARLETDQIPLFIQAISQTGKWKRLPLPESVVKNYQCKPTMIYLPGKLKNGLYYLHDFSPEKDSYAIAILNLDTNELFVYKADF